MPQLDRSIAPLGYATREPCKTCPYRRDVPPGTWAREEFENLVEQDGQQFGRIFQCHATKAAPQVCGGWLLDQARRGVPCISLRMAAFTKPAAAEALRLVSDGGHPTYGSIAEMVRANWPYWRGAARRRRGSRKGTSDG